MQTLAAEIIQGRRLTRLDDLTPLLQAGLEDLCAGADQIRKALRGAGYELCTIINARSGRCGEDCTFCAQSCHHQTQAQEYPFLEVEEIVRQALSCHTSTSSAPPRRMSCWMASGSSRSVTRQR